MKFNNNDGIIKYPLDEILKRIGYFEKREKVAEIIKHSQTTKKTL